MTKRNKRIVLVTLGLLLASCAALVLWAFFIEPRRLVVREETISIQEWPTAFDPLRIVLIADLHVGAPHVTLEKLREVVETINRQQPDLVLIAGDFVIQDVVGGEYVEPEPIAAELKNLRARDGVFAVLGNHDWWDDGERITRALNNAGVRVLENDSVQIGRSGDSIWIAGLADVWTRKPLIATTLEKVPAGAMVIALTHNPDIFPDIPARVPLTLAGHTHGGQVNLPLLGRRVVPSKFKERYAIGHIQENGHHLFVTPGIGTSIFPIRFRVPPEITVLTVTAGSTAP